MKSNRERTKPTSLTLKTEFMQKSIIPMIKELAEGLSEHIKNTDAEKNQLQQNLNDTLNNLKDHKESNVKVYYADFKNILSNTDSNQTTEDLDALTKEKMSLIEAEKLKFEKNTQKEIEACQAKIKKLDEEIDILRQQREKFLNDTKWITQHQWFLLRDYPKELKQRFQFSNRHLNLFPTSTEFTEEKSMLSENLSESLTHAKRCQTAAHCFAVLALLSVSPIILAGISIGFIILFGFLLEFAFKLIIIGLFFELGVFVDPARQLAMNIGHLIQGFVPYLAIAGGALLLIAVGLYLCSAFQDGAPQMTMGEFGSATHQEILQAVNS